jgi:hypothetical protein
MPTRPIEAESRSPIVHYQDHLIELKLVDECFKILGVIPETIFALRSAGIPKPDQVGRDTPGRI